MLFRNLLMLGWISCAFPLLADNFTLPVLSDGSQTYSNVTVIGANATDLYFTHSRGIGNVKLKYLEPALQKRFNYDPVVAAAAEQERVRDDTKYNESIASNLVDQAVRSARIAQKATNSSPDNLADPISEKALIGKASPPIAAERWLGPAPELKGKAILVCFWAPWSFPSRRYIPVLNAFQKRFAGRLVVIGIAADTEPEIAAVEPKLEFTSGIDSNSRLAAAVGVTCLPSVLLIDTKGIIRYSGHPAALDEQILDRLLPKAPE